MDYSCTLLAIEALRSNPAYQAAEKVRRAFKAKNKKKRLTDTAPGSREQAAARLLITTWITISLLLRKAEDKAPFFGTLPICHMYKALQDEIGQLRKTLNNAAYAEELQELYDEWDAWLAKQGLSEQYVTAMCGGLTARFG